ncbi:MAG: hypothetical protein MMC33_007103 [Icmadophila ericetorum]|nr:hypothetical protein [Icmadophila ericetorum]
MIKADESIRTERAVNKVNTTNTSYHKISDCDLYLLVSILHALLDSCQIYTISHLGIQGPPRNSPSAFPFSRLLRTRINNRNFSDSSTAELEVEVEVDEYFEKAFRMKIWLEERMTAMTEKTKLHYQNAGPTQ